MKHGSQLPQNERSIAVTRLRRRVARLLKNECIFPENATIVVGLSGGPDSAVLLDVLTRFSKPHGWTLHAVHINHQLKETAYHDEAMAESIAYRYGWTYHAIKVDVARDGSLQAAARDARYRALRDVAKKVHSSTIAVAHTADDQVETFLMRALTSGSPKSIQAIRYINGDIVRPLLSTWKAEILAYAEELQIPYLIDPSNTNLKFTRNRIRSEIIPVLEEVFPAAKKRLWRLSMEQQKLFPETY